MDGIAIEEELGAKFGRKPILVAETVQMARKMRKTGKMVPEINATDVSLGRRFIGYSAHNPDVPFQIQSGHGERQYRSANSGLEADQSGMSASHQKRKEDRKLYVGFSAHQKPKPERLTKQHAL